MGCNRCNRDPRGGWEMPADGLMMMFIREMTVDYGDQKLLFRDGRMRRG